MDCNVRLLLICDAWFELHTTTNCQHSNHLHTPGSSSHEIVTIKTEPAPEPDSEFNVETVDLKIDIDSDEILVHETNENDAFGTALSPFVDSYDQLTVSPNSQFSNTSVNNEQHLKQSDNKKREKAHPHQAESFNCDICGSTLDSFDALCKHMMGHSKSFQCEICKKSYTTQNYFKKHIKIHEKATENQRNAGPGTDLPKKEPTQNHLDGGLIPKNVSRLHPHQPTSDFQCDICQKVLCNYYSLKGHMLSKHSNRRKFECSICNKMFVTEKCLEKHRNGMHKNGLKKMHMCSVCGKLFPDRSNMRAHERSHDGIKVLTCEVCNKKFANNFSLKKHIKAIHNKERPFICNIDGCKWTFAQQSPFARHQARRHGMVKNRNPCPICSKEFPDSTYHLKRHLKAHENNTAKEYIPKPKPEPSQTS